MSVAYNVVKQFNLIIGIFECNVHYLFHDFIHDYEILLMILFQKPVKTISKLVEMCIMCKEEESSVTLRPCDHKYCPGILIYFQYY